MKNLILTLAVVLSSIGMYAQSEKTPVSIGDVFVISASEPQNYKHIQVPKPNIIRKRGGMPNAQDLKGSMVEITKVEEKKDGTTQVTMKRQDGTRFFGSHPMLKADLNAALQEGELTPYVAQKQ